MIGLLPIKEGSAYFRVDKSILSAAVINNFKKTKILYLITKGNWGGAQRYVFDLATNLPKNEWDVVVVHGKGEILAEKLKKNEIRTIQLKNSQRDINPFKDLLLFFELLGLYKREKPDVVHLNSSKIGFLGALTALIYKLSTINYKLKTVFTAHGWPFGERRFPPARALLWFFSWLTALSCHNIIVVSDFDLRAARNMPFVGKKTLRIYNGIGHIAFGSGDMIRQSFPKGVRITGTVGELNKNKNQKALIEQARKDPNLYVAIVGDGENLLFLKKKIEEYGLESRVKLMGFHWASEVLKGFDVFALPSIKEGLPYVLLEAKLAGLPIVANRVGGVEEILDAQSMEEFSLKRMVEKTVSVYSVV